MAIFLWKTLILKTTGEMGVNKITLQIVQSAEKGLLFQSFVFTKLPKTTLDSCSRRPSGKVHFLSRSLNIPDIIKLATRLQVNSAAHRYFSANSSGHLWILDVWQTYRLPVKILLGWIISKLAVYLQKWWDRRVWAQVSECSLSLHLGVFS